MMNEFPEPLSKLGTKPRTGGGKSGVVGFNGTEYLEIMNAAGVILKIIRLSGD